MLKIMVTLVTKNNFVHVIVTNVANIFKNVFYIYMKNIWINEQKKKLVANKMLVLIYLSSEQKYVSRNHQR